MVVALVAILSSRSITALVKALANLWLTEQRVAKHNVGLKFVKRRFQEVVFIQLTVLIVIC
jgi:hypothetical protein